MKNPWNNPSFSSEPKSVRDVPCRGCAALAGEACRLIAQRTWVRAQIRRGELPVAVIVRKQIKKHHKMRWDDFDRIRGQFAKIRDWEKRYAK